MALLARTASPILGDISGYPLVGIDDADTRGLLNYEGPRYNIRAWGRSPTGRVCAVCAYRPIVNARINRT
jgi:hypothetical protein